MKSFRLLKITFPLALMVLVAGCGTVIGRTGIGDMAYGEKIPRYYPATYVDGCLISESSPNASDGARAFWCVGGIIDMPISLAFDTLLLPYDASKSSGQTPTPTPTKPSEPN